MYFDMKEKCYVALDYERELEQFEKTILYELPDGNIISLGNERFKCTEALFNTRLLDVDEPSIHDVIIKSILKCNTTIRDKMYNNIVLAGGNTMFPGLRKRIDKELRRVAPDSANIKVEAGSKSPPVRKYSAWIGGSIFATTYNPDTWITKELYEEYGAEIVHVRCPTTSFQAEAMSNKSLFKCCNDFVDAEMY
jgi:actin